ncbi:Fic family protein [Frigoribacterium sp. CFBP 8766]|uniref:Fic/DOC family protein n=1 Tax=Frigoribacterium sp. CFBP 8766 TaxID=2775273 RepID=UPI00178642BF|nr:Fic family protein [Frigoribacterium sp. CFBP 8766]
MAGDSFDESFPDFESTLYPVTQPPSRRVMRNTENIRDAGQLQRFEYKLAGFVREEIAAGRVPIERTFDLEHAKQLNKELFEHLYPNWAGKVRPFGMTKADHSFADAKQIPHYFSEAHKTVQAVEWADVSRDAFAVNMAIVYANINQAHPFREGNGRTGKMFLEHVAEQSPFELDYSAVSAEVWNQRSHFSGPDRGYLAVHPEELIDVFKAITVERRPAETAAPSLSPELQKLADLYKTHYSSPPGRGSGAGTGAAQLSDYRPGRGAAGPGRQNGRER